MNDIERENKIVEMYQSGSSIRDIMDVLGGADYTIHRVLEKYKVSVKSKKHSQSGLSDQDRLDIIDKYKKQRNIRSLSKEYDVCKATISRILAKNQVEIKNKYDIREDFFENIDSEEKAYVLGFLYADGHNQADKSKVCLELKATDIEIIHKIGKLIYINEDYKLAGRPQTTRVIEDHFCNVQPTTRLYIYSKKICEDLVKLGCVQNKTLKCNFPNIPKELIRHFVRGYFDGDGTIIYNFYKGYFHSRISICVTPEFGLGLQKVVTDALNFRTVFRKASEDSLITNFVIQSAKSNMIFLNWLYKDSTIYLERKYQKYLNFSKDHRHYIETFYDSRKRPANNRGGQLKVIE